MNVFNVDKNWLYGAATVIGAGKKLISANFNINLPKGQKAYPTNAANWQALVDSANRVPFPIVPTMLPAGSYNADYYDIARQSAREMSLERQAMAYEFGKPPLTASELGRWFQWDLMVSYWTFIWNDYAETYGKPPLDLSQAPAIDVWPYDYIELGVAQMVRSARIADRRSKLALQLVSTAQPVTQTSLLTQLQQDQSIVPVVGGSMTGTTNPAIPASAQTGTTSSGLSVSLPGLSSGLTQQVPNAYAQPPQTQSPLAPIAIGFGLFWLLFL